MSEEQDVRRLEGQRLLAAIREQKKRPVSVALDALAKAAIEDKYTKEKTDD